MSTFKLNYKNGAHEIVQTDATTVADQINRTFGMTLEEAEAFGVSVEMLPDDPVEMLDTMVEDTLTHHEDTTIVPTADKQEDPPMSGTFSVSESSEGSDSTN